MEVPTPAVNPLVRQWAYAYADLGAKHVLEHYGNKAVGRLGRAERRRDSAHRQVDRFNRHTVVPVPPPAEVDRMLSEAFSVIPNEAACMRSAIHTYVRDRIVTQQPHDMETLIRVITDWGCDHSADAA